MKLIRILRDYSYPIWLGLVAHHYGVKMSWEHLIVVSITVILIELKVEFSRNA